MELRPLRQHGPRHEIWQYNPTCDGEGIFIRATNEVARRDVLQQIESEEGAPFILKDPDRISKQASMWQHPRRVPDQRSTKLEQPISRVRQTTEV